MFDPPTCFSHRLESDDLTHELIYASARAKAPPEGGVARAAGNVGLSRLTLLDEA